MSAKRSREEVADLTPHQRFREGADLSAYRSSTPVGSGSPFKRQLVLGIPSSRVDDIYASVSPKQMQTPAPNYNYTNAHSYEAAQQPPQRHTPVSFGGHGAFGGGGDFGGVFGGLRGGGEATLPPPSSMYCDVAAARDYCDAAAARAKAVVRDKAVRRVHEWVRITATEPEMDAAQRDDIMWRVMNDCQLKPVDRLVWSQEVANADLERLVWSLDAAFLGGALKAMALPNADISVSNRMSATLYSLQHTTQRTTLKISRMLADKCAAVHGASVFGVPVQDARMTLAYIVAGVVSRWVSEAAGMGDENCQQNVIARRKFGIDVSAHLTLPPSIRQTAETRGIQKGSIVAYMSNAGPVLASVGIIRKNITLCVPDTSKNQTSEPKKIEPYTFAAHFYPTIKLNLSQLRLADEEEKALFKRIYLAARAAATP